MDKQRLLVEILNKIQYDPYLKLPVDQKQNLDYEEMVINDLDDQHSRQLSFQSDPEVFYYNFLIHVGEQGFILLQQKPLQLLVQYNYEILTKEHFRIMIEIFEFLSKEFINQQPKDQTLFKQITTVLENILDNFIKDISNQDNQDNLKLEVIQQAEIFINCLQKGGFEWVIHPFFSNFIQKYDKNNRIFKIVRDKFNKLKYAFEQKVQQYKKQNKKLKNQKKEAKQIQIITAFRELKNEEVKAEKDEIPNMPIFQQKKIVQPTDENFEEIMQTKRIKKD